MAANTKSIIFKITEAGKQSALQASGDDTKILIDLTHVAVGKSKYLPTGNETALKNEVTRTDIVSGEVVGNTLRFTSTVYVDDIVPVYEMGIFTKTGVLFAVVASNTDPLVTLYPNIAFVTSFGVSIDDLSKGTITVSTDPNNSLATALMQNHVAATNPHPQYVALSRFQLLLDVMFPVGYLHHTNSTTNPKTKFDQLLGINTFWRRLTGRVIVGTDPNDNYIKDVGIVLGQKGMTELASANERPNVYPLYTKHIFERYNPDDVIETVWNISANKSSITEGGAVRFTVTANNIPDGQILNWTIKEGRLNSGSNDITTPDKSQSGTVILKNGSAVIDFATTPDDNAEELQKHVRLTVGAPASLSINVPINDLGNNESVVHITQSTTSGIQLDEYYKQQSGSYPTATDKIRFIVDAGVDIIAPNTSTPALIEGTNWPSGSQIIVENRGRILGRGGDGGKGAVLIREARYASRLTYSEAATKGQDGGVAIKSNSKPILVENYNTIAGGGGGGGGGGAYVYDFEEADFRMGHQNGTAAGGGAPLGKASINVGSAEWYLADSRNADRDFINANMNPNSDPTFYGIIYFGANLADAKIAKDGLFFSQRQDFDYPVMLRSDFKDVPIIIPAKKDPITNGGLYNLFKSQIDSDSANRIFFQKIWPDAENEVKNMSIICKRATDATTTQAGLGGYSVGAYADKTNLYQSDDGGDLSVNSGGKGGSYGENGETFNLSTYLVQDNVNDTNNVQPKVISKSTLDPLRTHELPPASGGLAGYIKEGSVTITNYSGGITKGR